jgi:hypothetical protein
MSIDTISDYITPKKLLKTLKVFAEEDMYIDYFLSDERAEDFLILLELNGLVFLASDRRVLLTSKGEKKKIKLQSELI